MDLLIYGVDAGIARITLNRPEKRNALNPELIAALGEALTIAARDAKVRVVLIAGAGKDFCAGLDLVGLDMSSDPGNQTDTLGHLASAQNLAGVLLAIRRHPRGCWNNVVRAAFQSKVTPVPPTAVAVRESTRNPSMLGSWAS